MAERFNIPEAVHIILNALNTAGYEAYIVGGCVRDSLMGRRPKDWDITTSARPEAVKQIFPHTYDTGIQHGTVTVRIGSETFEVTTYRVDGNYSDHRRPDTVEFSSNLREDLLRRDFTINAMAYHPKTGVVDYYGGKEDLKNGLIRCVGSPADRFQEDALRMLRALRFSAQLSFALELDTIKALRMLAPTIQHVSWERIREELNKIMISDHPETITKVSEYGLMQYLIPEWEACLRTEQHTQFHIYTVGEHTLEALQSIEADPVLRWTMFLHDIGKPAVRRTDASGRDHFAGHVEAGEAIADRILKRLKFDNASRIRILRLIRYHELRGITTPVAMRKAAASIGPDLMEDLFKVLTADAMAKNPLIEEQNLDEIQMMKALFEEIQRRQDPLRMADLAINGKDLKAMGYEAGPIIGRVLNLLLDQVLEEPTLNERAILLETARNLKDTPEVQNLKES